MYSSFRAITSFSSRSGCLHQFLSRLVHLITGISYRSARKSDACFVVNVVCLCYIYKDLYKSASTFKMMFFETMQFTSRCRDFTNSSWSVHNQITHIRFVGCLNDRLSDCLLWERTKDRRYRDRNKRRALERETGAERKKETNRRDTLELFPGYLFCLSPSSEREGKREI